MNKKFTHTLLGGKNVVASLKKNHDGTQVWQFESLTEFNNRFLHMEPVDTGDEKPVPLTAYKADKFPPRQGREFAVA